MGCVELEAIEDLPLADYQSCEKQLERLVPLVLGDAPKLLYKCGKHRFVPDRRWIHLSDPYGRTFALHFPSSDNATHYSQLLDLMERLAANGAYKLQVVEKFVRASPLFEHHFYSQDPAHQGVYVIYARDYFAQSTNSNSILDCRLDLLFQRKVHLLVRGLVNQTLRVGERIQPQELWLETESGQWPHLPLRIRLTSGESGIICEILEEDMIDDNELDDDSVQLTPVPVEIALGAIQMTIGDLLKLRAGMSFKFEMPADMQAVLRVGDAAWALARLEFESGKICLHIEELMGTEHVFGVSQET